MFPHSLTFYSLLLVYIPHLFHDFSCVIAHYFNLSLFYSSLIPILQASVCLTFVASIPHCHSLTNIYCTISMCQAPAGDGTQRWVRLHNFCQQGVYNLDHINGFISLSISVLICYKLSRTILPNISVSKYRV